MKSQKWREKYILPVELTNKIFENALRVFETWLTRPQLKSLKTVIRWLWKNWTTIISHIHEHTIETKKFIEKTSHHLWNMDIIATVEKKAKRCIMQSIKERNENNERTIIAYDETDIFKPDAKCMPWLMRIRDGSTGLTWNGYIVRWVNVNGISLYSHLEETLEWKLWNRWKETIKTIKKVQSDIGIWCGTYVIDRGADDMKVIKFLYESDEKFIIRMKRNRKILNCKNNKQTKITDFKQWRHEVEIWGLQLILYVHKKPNKKQPILLISNDTTLTAKKAVSIYLKRWKVEEDFKKMKELGLEQVRLLDIAKIKNLIALIQFIIILGQDIYEKVKAKENSLYEHVFLYFKNFVKWKSLTINPTAFIKFISFSLSHYDPYDTTSEPIDSLFWWTWEMKKLGII